VSLVSLVSLGRTIHADPRGSCAQNPRPSAFRANVLAILLSSFVTGASTLPSSLPLPLSPSSRLPVFVTSLSPSGPRYRDRLPIGKLASMMGTYAFGAFRSQRREEETLRTQETPVVYDAHV